MDERRRALREEVAELLARPGHAVDNARAAMAVIESALATGVLERSDDLDQTLADLRLALDQPEGEKLGGKSAEAARFITRRLTRLLEGA
jgi:phage shock protein A